MAALLRSVMTNECSTFVAAVTMVLHAVGMYAQNWSEMDASREGGQEGRVVSHEGLWRTCTFNRTIHDFQCPYVDIESAWLLTVQILVSISFGMAVVAAFVKMLYHFNASCNNYALIQGFILLGILSGFLLLLAVSVYAANYKDRYPHIKKPKFADHHTVHLGWTFTVEVAATAFSIAAALMSLCEKDPYAEYSEI